jgi:hypothetical protein
MRSHSRLYTFVTTIAFLLLLIPILAIAPWYIIVLSPFHLFFYSSNWGLLQKDYKVIQLYLDHFEALHPSLISYVAQYLQSPAFKHAQAPVAIKFWPTITKEQDIEGVPLVLMIKTTKWTFSVAAGLFMLLETAGFKRRTLYEFLQKEVEAKVPTLTAQEKEDFQRVTSKVCNYRIIPPVRTFIGGGTGFVLPESGSGTNEKVIPMKDRSVDWILDGSYPLIVPMDNPSYRTVKYLSAILPIWKVIRGKEEPAAGERAGWQVIDFR